MSAKPCVLLVVLLLISGCSFFPAGLASSVSPIENPKGIAKLGRAKGSATYFALFGFIPFGHPSYDKAIQRAIAKKGGTNMINVRSYEKVTWVFVGYIHTLYVEGEVVK